MAKHPSLIKIPSLVKRAMNLAEQMEYTSSCSVETGRLLQVLASQFQSGIIGEIGTGCGVGASWIVSALLPGTPFFTVEADETLAAAVRELFDPLLNVRVIHGDWREILQSWRFGMLYAGKASPRETEPEALLQSLRQGGSIVIDALTPSDRLPLEMREDAGGLREFWLKDHRLLAVEFSVSPVESVILATRIE